MEHAARTAARDVAPGHWYGAQLHEDAWRLAIPAAVVDELDRALARPALVLVDGAPDLPAVRAFLEQVRERMFHGSGVAVAGRLPVAEWGIKRAWRTVEMLAQLMGPPTEQTHDGVTLYAVEDRGLRPGVSVRRSLTNVPQPFHSDGPWVRRPPWVVGLYCLRAASTGGISRCISLRALLADLAEQAPDLARRLAREMPWHRQSEHAPGDSPVSRQPLVWHDEHGRWCARFYCDYVRTGYRHGGEPVDPMVADALQRLEAMADEPHRRLEYRLEAGDVAWVNNRWCAHSRTGFEPASRSRAPRLLVRVWHRLDGGPVALDG